MTNDNDDNTDRLTGCLVDTRFWYLYPYFANEKVEAQKSFLS